MLSEPTCLIRTPWMLSHSHARLELKMLTKVVDSAALRGLAMSVLAKGMDGPSRITEQ